MMIAAPTVGLVVSEWSFGEPGDRTARGLGRQIARGTNAPLQTRSEEAADDQDEFRKQDSSRSHHETPGQVQGSRPYNKGTRTLRLRRVRIRCLGRAIPSNPAGTSL